MLKISTSKLAMASMVALPLAFTACKKAEVYKPIPSFSVSTNQVNVGASGTNTTLTIFGTVRWTAASDQTWLKLVRTKGANDAFLVITADSNFTAEKKTAKITLTGEDGVEPFEVAVTQLAGVDPEVNISSSDGRLDSLGFGSTNFTILLGNSLNQKLTVSSDQTWLKIATTTSSYVSVNVDENEGNSNRSAKITIKNKLGDVIKEYTVTQVFDQFEGNFYGKNWRLDKATNGIGGALTLENCQKDDVYKFIKSNSTMSRVNANPGGGSCPTDTETGSFSVSTGSQREIFCNYFYDFNFSSYLYVESISSTKLVLKNGGGSKKFEFVAQ